MKNSLPITAKERARLAREHADAERIARDSRIEAAQIDFFTAADEIAALTEQIAALEASRRDAVERIAAEGESNDRIGLLLETSPAEVRKLRTVKKRQPAE